MPIEERDHTPSEHEPWCSSHQGEECTCKLVTEEGGVSAEQWLAQETMAQHRRILEGLPVGTRFKGHRLSADDIVYLRTALGVGESLMKRPKGHYARCINRLKGKLAAGERWSKNEVEIACQAALAELLTAPRSSHRYGALKILMNAWGVLQPKEPKPAEPKPAPPPYTSGDIEDLMDALPEE